MSVTFNWRKSSYTTGQGNCVEAASLPRLVAVRDSKDPSGPVLAFTPVAWRDLTASVKAGRRDLS